MITSAFEGEEITTEDEEQDARYEGQPVKAAFARFSARARTLVESSEFQTMIVGVICLAGVMVGISTDRGLTKTLRPVLTPLEEIVLWIFTGEIVAKLFANEFEPWNMFVTPAGGVDSWNVFDTIIVLGSGILPAIGSDQGSLLRRCG